MSIFGNLFSRPGSGGIFSAPSAGSHWADFAAAFRPNNTGVNPQTARVRAFLGSAGAGLAEGDVMGGFARGMDQSQLAGMRARMLGDRMPQIGLDVQPPPRPQRLAQSRAGQYAQRPYRTRENIMQTPQFQRPDFFGAMFGG